LLELLPGHLDVMEQAIWRIAAVLEEMKEVSPVGDIEFHDLSQAMKLDDRINARMEKLIGDSGLVLPEEAPDTA
jgi:hypothetical protein